MKVMINLIFGVLFSVFFCIAVFASDNIVSMWSFLELASLCIIPMFYDQAKGWSYFYMFCYILVSSFASSLLFFGSQVSDLFFFIGVAFYVKFAIFPFHSWLYKVYPNSKWIVVWCISTLLKAPCFVYLFCVGSHSLLIGVNDYFCGVTMCVGGVLFWFYTFNWKHYWCHASLGSSAVFLIMASYALNFDVFLTVFLVYFLWTTVSIVLLSKYDKDVRGSRLRYFCLLSSLISYPFSIGILYKFFMGLSMFSCGWWLAVIWVLFSIAEQYYLLKHLISRSVSLLDWSGAGEV